MKVMGAFQKNNHKSNIEHAVKYFADIEHV